MSRDEKERRVIDLYFNQGKTTREIIKELRVSPNYVSAILKKEEEKNNNNIVTNKQQQPSSPRAIRAYELFSNGKNPLQVAIALRIRQSDADKYNREYWKLKGLDKLNTIHRDKWQYMATLEIISRTNTEKRYDYRANSRRYRHCYS